LKSYALQETDINIAKFITDHRIFIFMHYICYVYIYWFAIDTNYIT